LSYSFIGPPSQQDGNLLLSELERRTQRRCVLGEAMRIGEATTQMSFHPQHMFLISLRVLTSLSFPSLLRSFAHTHPLLVHRPTTTTTMGGRIYGGTACICISVRNADDLVRRDEEARQAEEAEEAEEREGKKMARRAVREARQEERKAKRASEKRAGRAGQRGGARSTAANSSGYGQRQRQQGRQQGRQGQQQQGRHGQHGQQHQGRHGQQQQGRQQQGRHGQQGNNSVGVGAAAADDQRQYIASPAASPHLYSTETIVLVKDRATPLGKAYGWMGLQVRRCSKRGPSVGPGHK
jgi:hypothetical protein